MPQYTATTLASAAAQLAISLRDPANSYWSLTELYNSIIESLRIFQSLCGYYRDWAIFPTVASTAFYDLRLVIPTYYAFTVTDDDLLAEIQAHLLEPVTNPWTGTDQFSNASILSAMGNVRDQYLLDTGIYITRSTPPGPPPMSGRISLLQSIIDIRRAGWQDQATGYTFALYRTDEYAGMAYSPSWAQTPSLPYQYSVSLTPPTAIQLLPSPSNAGTFDLCTTNSGPALALNPIAPVVLGVPNDLCWGVKWGTLEQLLSADGDVRDPVRAKYAGDLYDLAVSIGRNPVTSLQVSVNDVLVPISSISDLDQYQPNWQNVTGNPTQASMVGANLLVLAGDSNSGTGIPNGVYSVTLDLARSFPIPDILNPTTSYVQVGLELLDAILDLAQHLCSFKMAGQEFNDTLILRNNFLTTCGLMNARLRSNAFYNLLISQPGSRQDMTTPRTAPRAPEETTV